VPPNALAAAPLRGWSAMAHIRSHLRTPTWASRTYVSRAEIAMDGVGGASCPSFDPPTAASNRRGRPEAFCVGVGSQAR